MTAAQQVLYQTTNASCFKAQEFLDAVCNATRQTFARSVNIVCEAGDADLSNETAMPLALIVNELLTNAAKHGANGAADATIRVGLMREGESHVLLVEDDGPGFDLSAVRSRSSGLQLVEGLARQLRGRFEVTTGAATRCRVRFS
jgi:two-component sensor histidine kinase